MRNNNDILQKVNQTGSLMIEAMAMLALISLVTPTLYKKSAERTTELQDINTATHLRTLIKAADNYAADHYEELISTDNDVFKLTEDGDGANSLANYLPYGYNVTDSLKNFDKPQVVIYRKNGTLTSYVELPTRVDVQPMRASRIASIIGSNGGYINSSGGIDGVGGSWGLDKDAVKNTLQFNGAANSVVATSAESITSATSNALENDKYLQRTKAPNDQKWRNTMATDLYMGGNGTNTMNNIYAVNSLVIGADSNNKGDDYGLVIDGKDALVGGNLDVDKELTAAGGRFQVTTEGLGEVKYGSSDGKNDYLSLSETTFDLFGGGLHINKPKETLENNYDTTVNASFTSTGVTKLATDGSEFTAGADGAYYINASGSDVFLANETVKLQNNSKNTMTMLVNRDSKFNGTVQIGSSLDADSAPSTPKGLEETWGATKLQVDGNAYVTGKLYSESFYTPTFNTKELHAGKDVWDDKGHLHATKNYVSATFKDSDNEDRNRFFVSDTKSFLRGPKIIGSLDINQNDDMYLAGNNLIELAAQAPNGVDPAINIQNDMIKVNTTSGSTNKGTIDIGTNVTGNTVNLGYTSPTFPYSGYMDKKTATLSITPNLLYEGTSNIKSNAFRTVIQPALQTKDTPGYDGSFEIRTTTEGIPLSYNNDPKFDMADPYEASVFSVHPNMAYGSGYQTKANVFIDRERINVSSRYDSWARILEVDTQAVGKSVTSPNTNLADASKKGSVYIRKGAIEVMPSSGTDNSANNGYGYVSASRFVANNQGTNDKGESITITPEYADDSISWEGTNPDVYMVNPAYTSVMHDIKLTTRGGARLSDILPDFINKGIYVVNNTYLESGISPNDSKLFLEGKVDETTSDEWASPYLGTVPAPQCPPGYARVMTLTPAGFMMGKAGALYADSTSTYMLTVSQNKMFNDDLGVQGPPQPGTAYELDSIDWLQAATTSDSGTSSSYYYLGTASSAADAYRPTPVYIQESTWLKSKVVPQASDGKACSGTGCGTDFIGWNAVMGFLYPYAWYGTIIDYLDTSSYKNLTWNGNGETLSGETANDSGSNKVYWNIFPVRANTLEAYATIYCYFDRLNLYGSGNQTDMADQYDYLGSLGSPSHEKSDTNGYVKRLNDPTLKYDAQW